MEYANLVRVVILIACFVSNIAGHSESNGRICPVACSCNSDLTSVTCLGIHAFSIPRFPVTTERLILADNHLGPVLDVRIGSLENLKYLDLNNNSISYIYPHVFENLTSLETLTLSHNKLNEVGTGYLTLVSHVRHIDISQNQFNEIPAQQLYRFENLATLNVSFNHLSSAYLSDRLHLLKRLSVIDFSGNNLGAITLNDFDISSYWDSNVPKFLNLSNCSIGTIDFGAISKMQSLHWLSLSNNNNLSMTTIGNTLRDIETTGIKILKLSKLKLTDITELFLNISRLTLDDLDISDNIITRVPPSSLNNLMTLKALRVAGNSLSKFGGISSLGNLNRLDISRNSLDMFRSKIAKKLDKLKYLDISGNNLMGEDNEFSELQHLIELHIAKNKITALNFPRSIDTLKILDVSNNRLEKVDFMGKIRNLEILDASGNWLKSLSPFMFPNMNLRVANLSQNRIKSPLHNNIFLPYNPHVIDLSNNQLDNIIYSGWKYTKQLYLGGNGISHVDRQSFYAMFNLTKLDLSRNTISHLYGETFSYLYNLTVLKLNRNAFDSAFDFSAIFDALRGLQKLNLCENNLTELHPDAFKHMGLVKEIDLSKNRFSRIDPKIFTANERLRYVNLADNNFVCDCNIVPFRDWVTSTTIDLEYGDGDFYRCSAPKDQYLKPLVEYEPDDLQCDNLFLYAIVFGSVAGLVLIVTAVAIIVCYCFCKMRKLVKQDIGCEKVQGVKNVQFDKIRIPEKQKLLTEEIKAPVCEPRKESGDNTRYKPINSWEEYEKLMASNGVRFRPDSNGFHTLPGNIKRQRKPETGQARRESRCRNMCEDQHPPWNRYAKSQRDIHVSTRYMGQRAHDRAYAEHSREAGQLNRYKTMPVSVSPPRPKQGSKVLLDPRYSLPTKVVRDYQRPRNLSKSYDRTLSLNPTDSTPKMAWVGGKESYVNLRTGRTEQHPYVKKYTSSMLDVLRGQQSNDLHKSGWV